MNTIVNTAILATALHLPLIVGLAHGQDNSATVQQTGTGNSVTATERNASLSGIDARQEGNNNSAVLSQIGVFPFLISTSQRGADNAIVVDESVGGFAGPVITQEGTANRARVIHYDDYYSGIGIEQRGERNQADLRQTSAYMTDGMTIIQHGADHRANVTNSGNMNSMQVSQTGTGHTSTTDQLGSGNRGVVFQR